MKISLYKRALFCLLAFLVCLSCFGCKGEEAPATTADELLTKTEDGKQDPSAPLDPTSEVADEYLEDIPDGELLGKIGAWRGMAESGTLQERDQYKMVTIKSKADLDPYRQYLTNFTEEYEKTILEDDGGTCVLIELTGTTENTLFGTSSISQAGSAITILISADEVEDVIPKYTFFLLYFPEEIYNGEVISIDF